jgi:hypothetical protein
MGHFLPIFSVWILAKFRHLLQSNLFAYFSKLVGVKVNMSFGLSAAACRTQSRVGGQQMSAEEQDIE